MFYNAYYTNKNWLSHYFNYSIESKDSKDTWYLNKTTANKEENKMSKELKEFNQIMLKNLKEKQAARIKAEEEAARIKAEKEAYEEAFYKLSNEEQIIIRKVEGELIQVNFKLMLEQMKKEKIKREKEEIKRLTKLIEKDRDRVRNDQITILSRATGVVCVLAYVGLTIITR